MNIGEGITLGEGPEVFSRSSLVDNSELGECRGRWSRPHRPEPCPGWQRHAGRSPGFPVTISQSGKNRLTGDLTVPDVDTAVIKITSDFVTLNLNGFSIIGPAVCTGHATKCPPPGKGIGVQAGADQTPAPRGIRVLNGSVREMGVEGVLLTGNGGIVERVTVESNAGGGMSVAGSMIEKRGYPKRRLWNHWTHRA